ncbi:ergothioneine biosynthesis protein EgtB [soil metagenome]
MLILEDIAQRYITVRQHSINICKPLSVEDFVVQPIVDVSPPKWHLGHTTWFFETFILEPYAKGYRTFDKDFSFIFNSYYESIGNRVFRADRGNITRPTVEEVFRYRKYVDQAMAEFFDSTEEKIIEDLSYVLEIGLQHEQQHQELMITDIKYILGHNPLFPVYLPEALSNGHFNNKVISETYLDFEEGIYEIGGIEPGFKFDNELGVHKVFLHPFKMLDRLITNGEYLDFMESGGYKDFRYWFSEGWDWVKENDITAPLYWHKIEGKWFYFTLNGLKELSAQEPVTHISFYEADAFASWKGKRLLTEFEWEIACRKTNQEIPENANFLNSKAFKPRVRLKDANQMFGDVWEWTQSAYLPYPFFTKEIGALGEYNGKFMVNQKVLRGGSCATFKEHIRVSYRNFFHPDKRWQFTGLRLAESLQ